MVKKKSLKSLLLLSKSIFVLLLLLFALTSIGEKVILIEKPLGFPELICLSIILTTKLIWEVF